MRGIKAIVRLLARQSPSAKLIVLGLLPRGDRSWDTNSSTTGKKPGHWIDLSQPSIFTAAIDDANRQLQRWLGFEAGDAAYDSTFLDCSGIFLQLVRASADSGGSIFQKTASTPLTAPRLRRYYSRLLTG